MAWVLIELLLFGSGGLCRRRFVVPKVANQLVYSRYVQGYENQISTLGACLRTWKI